MAVVAADREVLAAVGGAGGREREEREREKVRGKSQKKEVVGNTTQSAAISSAWVTPPCILETTIKRKPPVGPKERLAVAVMIILPFFPPRTTQVGRRNGKPQHTRLPCSSRSGKYAATTWRERWR
jgi:hypothetical protein